jgi:sirohydrochlorin ferrochelatase
MGAWGTGPFDDDVASDVRSTFENELEGGASVAYATTVVLREWSEAMDDEEDGPIVWLALASLQLGHGALQKRVRDEALAVIDGGQNQRRWDEETTPEDAAARRAVLEELRTRLLAS